MPNLTHFSLEQMFIPLARELYNIGADN